MTIRVFVCALLLGCATRAEAQAIASVDLGAASVRYDNDFRSGSLTLAPRLTWTSPRTSVLMAASYSTFDAGGWSAQGAVLASQFSPPVGPIRFEGIVQGGGSVHEDRTRTGQFMGRGRLHLMGQTAGVALGGGAGRTWDGEWRNVVQGEGLAWLQAADVLFLATATPTRVQDTSYVDVEGAIRWRGALLEVTAFGGVRGGDDIGEQSAWGGASAAWWVLPNLALVAGAGTYPADPTTGYPGGRYLTASIRLATRPPPRQAASGRTLYATAPPIARPVVAGFDVRRVPDGSVLVRVNAPGARRVEITGDFTLWEPVALREVGPARWEVRLQIPPGLHRMNVRVDGGPWGVPPDVTPLTDDFGGVVGILEVR